MLEEVLKKTNITQAELDAIVGAEVRQRGPLNWEWVQGILKAIDQHVPLGSGASIAIHTNDVYQYLCNPVIANQINEGVMKAMQPGVPTVVVAIPGRRCRVQPAQEQGVGARLGSPALRDPWIAAGRHEDQANDHADRSPRMRKEVVQRNGRARHRGGVSTQQQVLSCHAADREQDRCTKPDREPARYFRILGRPGSRSKNPRRAV